MRAILAVLGLALLLAGCASAPKSVADCGWVLGVPARSIDDGTRYDVKERLEGFGLDDVRYRFTNNSGVEAVTVYEGVTGDLFRAGGNASLRFVHAHNTTTLDLGDAFITLQGQRGLVLTLSSGDRILGGSMPCT